MTLTEYFTVVLSTIGGSTVVFLALVKWIGDIQAKRIIAELSNRLEIARDRTGRYDEAQFTLYTSLWESIANLQSAGDALWESASAANLRRFKTQLEQTQETVRRKAPFIEDEHREPLQRVLDGLRKYVVGKAKLVEIRDFARHLENNEIRGIIENNRYLKEEYEGLVNELFHILRPHIQGERPA